MFVRSREDLQASASDPALSAAASSSRSGIWGAMVAGCAVAALLATASLLPRGSMTTGTVTPWAVPAVTAFEALREVEACGAAQREAGQETALFGWERIVEGRSYLSISADRPGCGGMALSIPIAGLDAAGRESARHLAAGFQLVVQGLSAQGDAVASAVAFQAMTDMAGVPARITVSLSR